MGLSESKSLFLKIRASCQVIVKHHAFAHYPERGFSKIELIHLIRKGNGRFEDNKSPEAIKNSFLFFPKDEQGNECKLVILIEVVEIEDENPTDGTKSIIVCSAYRSIEK